MKRLLHGLTVLAALAISVSVVHAEFVNLSPSQTGQLTQFPGSGGNQSGLFAGLAGINQDGSTVGIRRGLLEFDIASSIPAGSTILSVTLQMYLLNSAGTQGPQTVPISLHDVSTGWGPTPPWPGPAFSSLESDSQNVNKTPLNTWYTWGSNSLMVQDVQDWLDNPSGNYGWLVQGNETDQNSVRRFSIDPGTAPVLHVEYIVPEPASLIIFGLGTLGLAGYACRRRKTA